MAKRMITAIRVSGRSSGLDGVCIMSNTAPVSGSCFTAGVGISKPGFGSSPGVSKGKRKKDQDARGKKKLRALHSRHRYEADIRDRLPHSSQERGGYTANISNGVRYWRSIAGNAERHKKEASINFQARRRVPYIA